MLDDQNNLLKCLKFLKTSKTNELKIIIAKILDMVL